MSGRSSMKPRIPSVLGRQGGVLVATSTRRMKKLARARQRATGELYTVALMHVRHDMEQRMNSRFLSLPLKPSTEVGFQNSDVWVAKPEKGQVLRIHGLIVRPNDGQEIEMMELTIGGSPDLLGVVQVSGSMSHIWRSYCGDTEEADRIVNDGGLPPLVPLRAYPILLWPNRAFLAFNRGSVLDGRVICEDLDDDWTGPTQEGVPKSSWLTRLTHRAGSKIVT